MVMDAAPRRDLLELLHFFLPTHARALIAAVGGHWAGTIISLAAGLDMENVLLFTIIMTVILTFIAIRSLLVAYRDPEGRARVLAGPGVFTELRRFVLVVGAASTAGGVALLLTIPEADGLGGPQRCWVCGCRSPSSWQLPTRAEAKLHTSPGVEEVAARRSAM